MSTAQLRRWEKQVVASQGTVTTTRTGGKHDSAEMAMRNDSHVPKPAIHRVRRIHLIKNLGVLDDPSDPEDEPDEYSGV
jgi:hypothetical protein